jgi:hypothetical protein
MVSDEGKACCDECERIYAESASRLEEEPRENRKTKKQIAKNKLGYCYQRCKEKYE